MPMPSRKYTPEQEKVLLAFLPGFVVTEPNTCERKLWKASLDVEWLTRWDMKPEHSGVSCVLRAVVVADIPLDVQHLVS